MVQMHNPAHPGEVLREFLPSGMTVGEVAARLGVSRPHLSKLLNCHTSMTADMAIRVAILTNTTPESWMSNQVKWDLWQSRNKPRPVIEPLPLALAA